MGKIWGLEQIILKNYNGRLQGDLPNRTRFTFTDDKNNEYLEINQSEWQAEREKWKENDKGNFPKDVCVLLRHLYETKMQEMAKTDANIARIYREYLKRRDGDKIEQEVGGPEDVQSQGDERS